MPRAYRLNAVRRATNALVRPLTRYGLAGRHTYVLVVPGRKSGRLYEVPVTLIENEERWLVSPYGEVAWVRNARAAGEIELRRGGRSERLKIEEVPVAEAAPVLRIYLARIPVVRPYFEVTSRSSLEDFEREAPLHPVFRLR